MGGTAFRREHHCSAARWWNVNGYTDAPTNVLSEMVATLMTMVFFHG